MLGRLIILSLVVLVLWPAGQLFGESELAAGELVLVAKGEGGSGHGRDSFGSSRHIHGDDSVDKSRRGRRNGSDDLFGSSRRGRGPGSDGLFGDFRRSADDQFDDTGRRNSGEFEAEVEGLERGGNR